MAQKLVDVGKIITMLNETKFCEPYPTDYQQTYNKIIGDVVMKIVMFPEKYDVDRVVNDLCHWYMEDKDVVKMVNIVRDGGDK